MAQLFFKRAKIFMLNDKGVSKRYVGSISATGTADSRVPDWVRETETFKAGVKDGSIIDLTPVPQRRREPEKSKKALGHDPLKEPTGNKKPETPVDEALSASDGDDAGDASDEQPRTDADEAEPGVQEAAQEAEAPAKPFGNQMPQRTPKGFSNQPTASGRRAAK